MKKRKQSSSSTGQKRRKRSKKDQSVNDGEPSSSRLLALPGELREKIYKLVLMESEKIHVTATLKEPSFLSVNRRIRREARHIWYNDNAFAFEIAACDDSLLSAFVKHCRRIKVKPKFILDTDLEKKSWTNLEKWCENIWNKNSIGYRGEDPDGENVFVVAAAAHHIVSNLRSRLSWDECATALGELKAVVQMFDFAWK